MIKSVYFCCFTRSICCFSDWDLFTFTSEPFFTVNSSRQPTLKPFLFPEDEGEGEEEAIDDATEKENTVVKSGKEKLTLI